MFEAKRDVNRANRSGFSVVSQSNKSSKLKIPFIIFWPTVLFYMELIMRLFINTSSFFRIGLFYTFLFSYAIGTVLTIICTIWTHKVNRKITIGLLSFITFLFSFHYVCRRQFQTFFTLSAIGMAGDLTDFWKEAIVAVLKGIPVMLLFAIPLILYAVFGKTVIVAKRTKPQLRLSPD